ncbi:MAG: hypothetical protein K2K87_08095 [Lachnospiraceae bacterium]|nr:hypothetical protein [Lachnospiraceae bacterium]
MKGSSKEIAFESITDQNIDMTADPIKRIVDYVAKGKDPYSLKIDGYTVELGWIDSAVTLQDKIIEIFASCG